MSIGLVYHHSRQLSRIFYHYNPLIPGGEGVTSQIDESVSSHKPKFYRERAPESEIWAFGIADTSFLFRNVLFTNSDQ